MTAESGGPECRLDVRQSGHLVLRQTLLRGGSLSSRSVRAAVRAAVKPAVRAAVKASVKTSVRAAVWQRTPEKFEVLG